MARPYRQYVDEEKGTAKEAFNKHFSDVLGKLHNRPQDFERVQKIQAHSENARQILNETFQEERQERVSKMAVEVWGERSRKYFHYPEHIRIQMMMEHSILDEARNRVDRQHDLDLKAITKNESEAIERVVNTKSVSYKPDSTKEIAKMSEQEKQTHLKAEMHKLAEDAREARYQVSMLVNSTRETMLEEARNNGAEDPAGQVKAVVSSMYKGVEDKLHGDIHAAFQKYGYDADHQQVQFLANGEDVDAIAFSRGRTEDQSAAPNERSEDISETDRDDAQTQALNDDQDQ